MAGVSINTVFNINLDFELASFPLRLLAYIIDFGIMVAYIFGMQYVLVGNKSEHIVSAEGLMGLSILLVSFPMLMYPLICEVLMNGQSIGKKILQIRVVSLSGDEPTLGQYILRWMTRFFEWPFLFGFVFMTGTGAIGYAFITMFFGIGVFIIINVNARSQRLGDMLAGTVVVRTQPTLGIKDTIFQHVDTNYTVTYPQVMRLSDIDINTIRNVIAEGRKKYKLPLYERVAYKIVDVLEINNYKEPFEFLQTLLADYNYLATLEKN